MLPNCWDDMPERVAVRRDDIAEMLAAFHNYSGSELVSALRQIYDILMDHCRLYVGDDVNLILVRRSYLERMEMADAQISVALGGDLTSAEVGSAERTQNLHEGDTDIVAAARELLEELGFQV